MQFAGIVRTDEVVAGFGVNDHEAVDRSPATLKVTGLLNPSIGSTMMVFRRWCRWGNSSRKFSRIDSYVQECLALFGQQEAPAVRTRME